MRKGWLVLIWPAIAVLLLLGGVAGVLAQTGEPVARFYLFYSETCPHCHDIMENYLPTVYEKYGSQVEYEYLNIYNDVQQYTTMLALEKKLGVPESEQGYVPALVIGEHVLIGSDQIPAELEGLIDEYLAQGGVDFPSLEDLPEVVLPTAAPKVQMLVLMDPNADVFGELAALMSSLDQQYPGQLEPYVVDTTQSQNATTVTRLNEAFGRGQPSAGTPEVLIDRQLLVGMAEIESKLPGLVEQYAAQGVSVPPLQELMGGQPASTPTPQAAKPIYLAYFEKAGCQECARTTYDLQVIEEQYPQVVVERFSIEESENKALNEWLSTKMGVPEEKRLSTPMVFVGQDVLIGLDANLEHLLPAVEKYVATGAERTWADFDPTAGAEGIVNRFQSLGLLTVVGAGLIDGLNPCAFATLVFFISYLTFTGRRGREVLFVGLSFALGVFVTYLLVGVGLLKVVQTLGFFTALGRWVYLLTALLCLVLAAMTFRDVLRAREGKAGEMSLKLPMGLRRRINKVIREGAQVRAFVAMAFFTGFVVSLIELACTGQVYLPTIVYVLSRPEMAAQAFLYLLLYCLMFIVPLIIVFVLSYFGTTSEQLAQFVNRHTAAIKLATGLVFTGLALWMTWTLAPLFGVYQPWTWLLMAVVLVAIALAAVVLEVRARKISHEPAPKRRRSRA